MPSHRVTDREVWRVRIPEHEIERESAIPRRRPSVLAYRIEECVSEQHVQTRQVAIMRAVLEAHVRAEVPAWKPYMRQTYRLASAERVTVSVGVPR